MAIVTPFFGPFPSGRRYFVEEVGDPGNPEVHARYRLMVQQGESGPLQSVTPTGDPMRTVWTVSDWRDSHLANPTPDPDDRPLVRFPQQPGPAPEDVFTVEEAFMMMRAAFLLFIEANEPKSDGPPPAPETGDGLDDLRAMWQSVRAGDWKLPGEVARG